MALAILIFVLVLVNSLPPLLFGGRWQTSTFVGATAMTGVWTGVLWIVVLGYGGGCALVCDDGDEALLGGFALISAVLLSGLVVAAILRRRAARARGGEAGPGDGNEAEEADH